MRNYNFMINLSAFAIHLSLQHLAKEFKKRNLIHNSTVFIIVPENMFYSVNQPFDGLTMWSLKGSGRIAGEEMRRRK